MSDQSGPILPFETSAGAAAQRLESRHSSLLQHFQRPEVSSKDEVAVLHFRSDASDWLSGFSVPLHPKNLVVLNDPIGMNCLPLSRSHERRMFKDPG